MNADWHTLDLPGWGWLVAFCGPLVIFLLCLCLTTRRRQQATAIRVGNPLLAGQDIPVHTPPTLQPLIHLTRVLRDRELHDLTTGLRHLPLTDTAPILQRLARSQDPALQLHAQSILQGGQSELQERFTRLDARTTHSEACLASYMESGLQLLESPLTPLAEHPSMLARMQSKLADTPALLTLPRALHAAALVSLKLRQPAPARAFLQGLPEGSPLRASLERKLTHHEAIHTPPPPVTSKYQVR